MSVTKELIEQERLKVQAGYLAEVHLHKEGTFLRAYDWSAFLCCRFLHTGYRVQKILFKPPVSAFLSCRQFQEPLHPGAVQIDRRVLAVG